MKFQVTDTNLDESGADVQITEGGIGHKYVEIRMQSQIGKKLDYVIVVYTDFSNRLNETEI